MAFSTASFQFPRIEYRCVPGLTSRPSAERTTGKGALHEVARARDLALVTEVEPHAVPDAPPLALEHVLGAERLTIHAERAGGPVLLHERGAPIGDVRARGQCRLTHSGDDLNSGCDLPVPLSRHTIRPLAWQIAALTTC